jgi:membrane fusion protein (multidrug efflux system)
MAEPTVEQTQTLHDEQIRLRTEIDLLRRQQEDLRRELAEKKGNENGDKKSDDQSDKQQKDKQDKDKDQKKDDKPKMPASQRARIWVKSHPIATVLLIIGFVVLLIAGYLLLQYLNSYESTDDAEVDGHTDPISSRIIGDIVGVYVQNTQHVTKGQVLVDLDPRDYKVALSQANANLAQAEAALRAQSPNVPITATVQQTQVANANLDIAGAEAALAGAQQTAASAAADLKQAEANAANAEREEERYRQLVGKQEVSREQYDQKTTAARADEALVVSRRASAEAASKNVEQRVAALNQSRQRYLEAKSNLPRNVAVQNATVATRVANVQAAKAQVEQAALNLTYCKILAPSDGIVGDKTVEVGQHVAPGQEMFAITQTDDIWVTANMKETQIRNTHPGQSVTIYVDALSQDFNGYVEALPGATGATYSLLPPENATGNYVKVVQRLQVRIRFKPGQPHAERLHPGMSVEPKVWINTQ